MLGLESAPARAPSLRLTKVLLVFGMCAPNVATTLKLLISVVERTSRRTVGDTPWHGRF